MFRMEASPTAALALDTIPGLRRQVESTLRGLFDTAVELRRMHGRAFDTSDRFMSIRVGDYMVSYLLDLDASLVRALLVEPVEHRSATLTDAVERARRSGSGA